MRAILRSISSGSSLEEVHSALEPTFRRPFCRCDKQASRWQWPKLLATRQFNRHQGTCAISCKHLQELYGHNASNLISPLHCDCELSSLSCAAPNGRLILILILKRPVIFLRPFSVCQALYLARKPSREMDESELATHYINSLIDERLDRIN